MGGRARISLGALKPAFREYVVAGKRREPAPERWKSEPTPVRVPRHIHMPTPTKEPKAPGEMALGKALPVEPDDLSPIFRACSEQSTGLSMML